MDKREELRVLSQVFGEAVARQATPSERPDFVVALSGGGSLGIEVTSVYANNSDAKLKLLPEYTRELLDKKKGVHRADRGKLKIEEATLLDPDGKPKGQFTAIFQEMPSPKESFDLLRSKIAEKEEKSSEYLRRCDWVDLIVLDGSNLFHHEKDEDFYGRFAYLKVSEWLRGMRFREVYLLTTTKDQKRVFIPLLANAFVADCFAFEHMLKEDVEAGGGKEVFQLLVACLHQQGYDAAKMFADENGIGLLCGAWEVHYGKEAKNIRDWMMISHTHRGDSLGTTVADIPDGIKTRAKQLIEARANWRVWLPIRLPAHPMAAPQIRDDA